MNAAYHAAVLLQCDISEEFVGKGRVEIAMEEAGPFGSNGPSKIVKVTISDPSQKFEWLQDVIETADVRSSGIIEFKPEKRLPGGTSMWAILIPNEEVGEARYEFRASYVASGHPIISDYASGTCQTQHSGSASRAGAKL